MRATPFSRGLLTILAIMAILSGGCRSQTPRFYTLSPIPEDQVASKKSTAQNAVIGIGPVKIADYLDTSMLINRTSENQAVKAEFDRWVGSFKDNFVNVLADDLGTLLSTDRIYLYPWRLSVPIDYQVVVDVVRCDARLGDAAWLEARWSVFNGPEKKVVKISKSTIRESVSGPGYEAVVAAQSRAVAKLSQEIARAIRGTADATGSRRPASPGPSTGGGK
jgi:uncharacterized protein